MLGHNSDRNQRIFRSNPDTGYTKISNAFLQDQRLSYETRGMMAELLSRPDDWEIRAELIVKSGLAGRDKVWRMLREAEEFGYAAAHQGRTERGKFNKQEYVITDDPRLLIERAARELQGMISPFPENTCADILPFPENTCAAFDENVGNQGVLTAHWKPVRGNPPCTGSPCTANPQHTKERYIQTTETTLERAAKVAAIGIATAIGSLPAAAAPIDPPAIVQPVKQFHDLANKLHDAGGRALNLSRPILHVVEIPRNWIAAGCDLEKDILPIIGAMTAGKPPNSIGTWKYFEGAIMDAKAARCAPMSAPRPRQEGKPFDRQKAAEDAWLDRQIAEAKRDGLLP
jgi:hypothetical protein